MIKSNYIGGVLSSPWLDCGISPAEWFYLNIGEFALDVPAIIGNKTSCALNDTPNDSGVYFLISNGEIVYVGKSNYIYKRLIAHRKEGKSFDEVSWIIAHPIFIERMEYFYINHIKPALNVKYIGGQRDMSIDDFIKRSKDDAAP